MEHIPCMKIVDFSHWLKQKETRTIYLSGVYDEESYLFLPSKKLQNKMNNLANSYISKNARPSL
ncbi:MAG: putative phosphoadenosine phosphosulfate sulfurtransferase [Candidatus Paceibacteria bacterium]|jgi:predicted phosphoadenosine phosphosulfate sulfurtransferase